jgi:hypothetical protein
MATREAVHALGHAFSIIEKSAKEIDSSSLDPDMPGMTPIKDGFLDYVAEAK